MQKSLTIVLERLLALGLLGAAVPAGAQVIINDTLTGASSSYNWQALNGACLTAGNNTGPVPACKGLSYYTSRNSTLVGGVNGTFPDPVGQGALRLTNGDTTLNGSNGDSQTGAVVGLDQYFINQGLQVTFTTVTYGGDGNNGTGADGISFFLADGSKAPSVGALGGSLGYSCSNSNAISDGVDGGYLGVGIDEYGNFDNSVDNTNSDDGSPKNGNGLRPGRITIRGAGDTTYAALSAAYPDYYPAKTSNISGGDPTAAVRSTCSTGTVWNYSKKTVNSVPSGKDTQSVKNRKITLASNYPVLASTPLPPDPKTKIPVSISNQEGVSSPVRSKATPITYALKITQDGLMDFSFSVNGGSTQTIFSQYDIKASNGPLPASFHFGFSSGTGGSSNVHEITCFKAAPVNQSNSSAGTNVQQSSRVETSSQLYLAFYHPVNWWGELTAQSLLYDPVADVLSAGPVNWNASCKLTGGACQAPASTGATAQAPTGRTMLSWNPTLNTGIPFAWGSLSTAQQNALSDSGNSTTDQTGQIRLNYLRGDRSNEIPAAGSTGGGKLRGRTGVLGDVFDSSPSWVGPPASPYTGPWLDMLYPSATMPEAAGSTNSYADFKTARQTRQNVVYVGANDGFLHGFRSGTYDTSNNPVANDPTNDGQEVLAYMPSTVLQTIHSTDTPSLDYSSTQYSHNFYVDATPGTGDLYYNGSWHTWLVSGLGAGGNATGPIGDKISTGKGTLFALDITDPSQFSQANAAALVMGEWTSDTLQCVGNTTCGSSLGNTYGTPIVRRLHNGDWAVLFGNGLNSATGTAGLFIMLVDATSGAITFRFIDTGYGPGKAPNQGKGAGPGSTDATANANAKNGIAYVSSSDLDSDHITDYVYGGDAFGNLWRFDLTSSNPGAWSVSAAPLFTTATNQPITSRVTVSSILGVGPQGQPGVMVSFGTGQQIPQTNINAAQYAAGTQALYGIWDSNLAAWNAKASTSAQYASLANPPATVTASALQTQTITSLGGGNGTVSGFRTISALQICWMGSTNCGSGTSSTNNKLGWTVALPTASEQVIYNPTTEAGMLVVNTTIPAVSQALTCDAQPPTGFTMAVSLATGGAPPKSSFFPDQTGSFDNGVIAGIGLGGTGTPSFVQTDGLPRLVTQTSSGTPQIVTVNPNASTIGQRLTWIKRR